jgi:N-acetylglucosaminyldiphosphoundecaprenol N-acetyl-beta-D-mannosaminyltransferase
MIRNTSAYAPACHERTNVLGVGISAIDMDDAVRLCDDLIAENGRGYVCVTGVHGVMEAQSDARFRHLLNDSFLSVPDGMPMVWVGRLQGHRQISRVYGPDFMLEFCRHSVQRGYRHFLYGGNEGVAEQLAVNLRESIPGLQIVGLWSPPFRPLNQEEENELAATIDRCRPDVIWVGLSTPKQERFMAEHRTLNTNLMIGVGAAFDLHTGRMTDAPDWMKLAGLQWLHRLCQEPRRLWKRYLINNPKFIFQIMWQLAYGLRGNGPDSRPV